MIEEAVAAVKKAESQADDLLRQTQGNCAGIIREAEDKAKKQKEQLLKEAQKEAAARMEQAKCQGEIILAESAQQAAKEADSIRLLAQSEEEKAVEAVLNALIE